MPEFLKGNYKVDTKIEDKGDAADSTDEFEKKALSRLFSDSSRLATFHRLSVSF